MYESFYKLTTKPFRLVPDAQFFYPSTGHKRALSYLLYGLNQAEGFVVITGTPGTGKTTLAHKLLSQIDTQSVLVAHLTATQIEAEDLLRLVAASFKLRSENVSKAGLLKDIESFLLARSRERKRCLLVVDEAQNLPPRSIEELRMLSNFQVGSKALLQIFLLGQEQFRTMLNSENFEQLRQRVIADFHLQPLDAEETRRYIEARLQIAQWKNDPQFDAGAYTAIFEYTRGLPRRINVFCDRLMLYGFLEGLHVFTRESVGAVVRELGQDGTQRHDNAVLTPVESNDVRSVAAATVPFARITPSAPADVAGPIKTVPKSMPPAPTANVERMRPIVTAQLTAVPAAARENAAPTLVFAPPPALAERQDTTSVFAAKIARETRGESAAPPLLIDHRHPTARADADMELASTSPLPQSLASAETRWLWVLVSTMAVILMFALWFYPQLRSLFVPLPEIESISPPGPTDNGSSVSALPGSESTAEIQTEPSPTDPSDTPTEIAAPTSHTGSETVNTMQIQATTASSTDVPATTDTTTLPAPEALLSALPVITPAPLVTATTPESVAPAAATTEKNSTRIKSPAKNAPAIPPALPVIAKDNVAKVTVISERELALLLRKFARTYAQGDLTTFIALFDPDVSTEDHNTVEAVLRDYSELFRKTAARQIAFGDIRWEITGEVAHGTGPFEVRVRATDGEPFRILKGNLRLRAQKKGNRVWITALYHK